MCSRPAWVTEEELFSEHKPISNKVLALVTAHINLGQREHVKSWLYVTVIEFFVWHFVIICSSLEMHSHKWAHKAAVTRTDLLSTWLLFHRCHGECPGLFLIPTVVFHPRYPQSPYKDRKERASRVFQLPKAEDVYCLFFFSPVLEIEPKAPSPSILLALHRQSSDPSLPRACTLSLPIPPTHCTHRDPHWLRPISIPGSFQTYSPCNRS